MTGRRASRILGAAVRAVLDLRDPTRGGVATAFNELARGAGVAVVVGGGRWRRCADTPGARAPRSSGTVRPDPAGLVLLRTQFGGSRIVDVLVGDPRPRIR